MPMTARPAKPKCDARKRKQEDRRTRDASRGARPHPGLTVVDLRSHGSQPLTRHAIGPAAFAADQPLFPKLSEDARHAVRQPPFITRDAVNGDDVAAVFLDLQNAPALRERVQRVLLVFRDVQGSIALSERGIRPRP